MKAVQLTHITLAVAASFTEQRGVTGLLMPRMQTSLITRDHNLLWCRGEAGIFYNGIVTGWYTSFFSQ